MDYSKDSTIDINNLDKEWIEQPVLYAKYAAEAIETMQKRDIVKEEFELVKAQLDSAIRNEPSRFKLEKVTDKTVPTIVIQQKKYKEASKKYLDTKYAHEAVLVALKAIEMKKKSLEGLVTLYVAEYFSVPKEKIRNEEVKNNEIKQKQREGLNINRQGY